MSGSAVGIALAGGLSVLLHVLWQHARVRGVLLEAYQYLLLHPEPTAFKEPTVLQTFAQVQTSEPGEVGRGSSDPWRDLMGGGPFPEPVLKELHPKGCGGLAVPEQGTGGQPARRRVLEKRAVRRWDKGCGQRRREAVARRVRGQERGLLRIPATAMASRDGGTHRWGGPGGSRALLCKSLSCEKPLGP